MQKAVNQTSNGTNEHTFDYDYVVIGSGFGGSVSALRLSEKGYRVAVFEMGKRYTNKDFPSTNWNLRKYFWKPLLGLRGFFRMTLFKHAWVLSGVGVGGGSLVYACTSLSAPDTIWDHPQWCDLKEWKRIMPQHYETASKMLGITENRHLGPADKLLHEAASKAGYADSYYRTRVAIHFGQPGKTVPDPYFDGEGPERTGCTLCGGCMSGCRHGAKNSLDKNYLYFAEKNGVEVIAETRVEDVEPLGDADGRDGYKITVKSSAWWPFKRKKIYTTRGVVFAGGVLGSVKLLLECKARGSLPALSHRLGDIVRTNSESILGVHVESKNLDVSRGIAIGSGFYLDEHTHVEAVRYAKGSDALLATATLLAKERPGIERILAWVKLVLKHPIKGLRPILWPFGTARQSIILLVMQTLDGHLRMRLGRSKWFPFVRSLQTDGPRVPTYIPQANRFAELMANMVGGTAMTAITEILFDVPTTAHILGGAVIGANADEGVVDAENKVFGYENMLICDGSIIGANLGVNPSVTITALSEHAMSYIPPAGDL